MRITVKRKYYKETYIIGHLYVDGEFICDTLEDKWRGLRSEMSVDEIKKLKVPGQTAIPSGIYTLEINYSPRFKKLMPQIMYVKGFEGVRIHTGNTDKDTEGCILVGYNTEKGKVLNSRKAYDLLWKRLQQNKDKKMVIEIQDLR